MLMEQNENIIPFFAEKKNIEKIVLTGKIKSCKMLWCLFDLNVIRYNGGSVLTTNGGDSNGEYNRNENAPKLVVSWVFIQKNSQHTITPK